MKPLFSKRGLKALETLASNESLYAFDYDGTLSKIVRDPTQARLSGQTLSLLRELSRLAPVAVISGRNLSDLKSRVNLPAAYFIGNHGLEGLPGRKKELTQAKKLSRSWEKELKARLEGELVFRGGEVDNKVYSLSVHFRACRNHHAARRKIMEAVSFLNPPPRVIHGKAVVNLVPPSAPHKGTAMLDLMKEARVRTGFYIGDDDTDEDVFSLRNRGILSVRVGQKSASCARYFIPKQSDIHRLLRLLIRLRRVARGD